MVSLQMPDPILVFVLNKDNPLPKCEKCGDKNFDCLAKILLLGIAKKSCLEGWLRTCLYMSLSFIFIFSLLTDHFCSELAHCYHMTVRKDIGLLYASRSRRRYGGREFISFCFLPFYIYVHYKVELGSNTVNLARWLSGSLGISQTCSEYRFL